LRVLAAAAAAARRRAEELSRLATVAKQKALEQQQKLGQLGSASAVGQDTASPAAPARLTAEQIIQGKRFLARGRKFLKSGRINAGRLFLERAAAQGSADGAMALGESYDPVTLNTLGAVGMLPDKVLAAKWYRRAAELGADGAKERLQRLGRE